MEITVLYAQDCPHWRLAEARVREALRAAGTAAVVRHHRVGTPEQAERLGFHGSPTILVDGRDLFVQEPAPAGLSCRIYQSDAGVAGAPMVSQLIALLADVQPSKETT